MAVMLVDNAPKVAGTVIALTVIAYTVLPLRFYIRTRNKTLGLDDLCMAIAAVR
jgi:predicted secreted protein